MEKSSRRTAALATVCLLALTATTEAGHRAERAAQFVPEPAGRPPTCLLSRVVYNSGEMIERQNPCDFCFCYKGEVLCWKKQCPPPPPQGDCRPKYVDKECCPRYMCDNIHERFNFI